MELPEKDRQKLADVFKKTERIATAMYLITELMKEWEPLRNSLRTLSIKAAVSDKTAPEALANLKDTLHSLSSAFKIAHEARLVSDMNYRVTVTELMNVRVALDTVLTEKSAAETVTLDKQFFTIPTEAPTAVHIYEPRPVRTVVPAGVSAPQPVRHDSERRETVLLILRGRPGASVRDIADSPQFAGKVSEKTIQRELVSLVEQGVVQRSGERRWSRYSVTPNSVDF